MAKWQAMSAGALKVPVVPRCSVEDWSGPIAHVPGLKVFYPATPCDAKGLIATALSNEDPVVFPDKRR